MTRPKGTPNYLASLEAEFHPFTPSREPGNATQLEQTCRLCDEKLWTFPWNSKRDMTTCLNEYCPAWKQPVSGR